MNLPCPYLNPAAQSCTAMRIMVRSLKNEDAAWITYVSAIAVEQVNRFMLHLHNLVCAIQ